jgi:hypothetical protein
MNGRIYPGPVQDLLDSFQLIEKQFKLTITEEDFIIGRQQLLHIFNHETLHAVISKKVSWIHELEESEETLVDEILVRVLNHHFVHRVNLTEKLRPYYVPDTTKDVRDLEGYGVGLPEERYVEILNVWKKRFGSPEMIEPMAQWLLDEHRAGRILIDLKDT